MSVFAESLQKKNFFQQVVIVSVICNLNIEVDKLDFEMDRI